jgi:hypothetical protein
VDYDVVSLARIVRESSGESQKLAEKFLTSEEMQALLEGENKAADGMAEEAEGTAEEDELANVPADIIVEISRDRMQATVRFDTRKGRGLRTVNDIQDALAAKKVVFGINVEAIKKGIKALSPFVAARGIPPQHGENAIMERKFDLGVKGRPVVDKYDRVDYKNLKANGADLALSGHTHAGQMFPATLFTPFFNENNYGFKVVDDLQTVVTSGVGYYGPPLRVGCDSEIMVVNVYFKK